MKFISWNVNGIRAVMTKDFENIFKKLNADIFCLQETKVQAGQIEVNFEGYHQFWNYAEKKGYSMVIAKNIVICGGVDITEHVAKIIK